MNALFRLRLPVLLHVLLVLFTAAALKVHYSRAAGDDLDWILAPTAALAEIVGGLDFEREAHTGYLERTHGLIIAPSCAGVNFLIIAFCMAALTGLRRRSRMRSLLIRGAAALAVAYLATVGVNALRIAASLHLYRADIYGGWLTPRGVHRSAGAAIYLLALFLLHAALPKAAFRRPCRHRRAPVPGATAFFGASVPAAWYLAVAVGAPLLKAVWAGGTPRLADHALSVTAVCLLVTLAAVPASLSFVRIAVKMRAVRRLFRRRRPHGPLLPSRGRSAARKAPDRRAGAENLPRARFP